jgi:hypothetical protein
LIKFRDIGASARVTRFLFTRKFCSAAEPAGAKRVAVGLGQQ